MSYACIACGIDRPFLGTTGTQSACGAKIEPGYSRSLATIIPGVSTIGNTGVTTKNRGGNEAYATSPPAQKAGLQGETGLPDDHNRTGASVKSATRTGDSIAGLVRHLPAKWISA
jgi:hypothetical protein